MHSDRKSMAPPRTPSTTSAHKVAFNVPPPSGFHSRTSVFSSRTSLVAEARSSIAGGGGGGYSMAGRPSAMIPGGNQGRRFTPVPRLQPAIKDDRNLREKDAQAAVIQKVVRFLEDRMDPAPQFRFDDRNFLRSPSKNDFKNVFEYLFQCIEPNFQVKKIEDDALRLMNQLGYPYPLKPSTMQTMSVPSTWHQLLGVLDWLVDIVEVENALYQNKQHTVQDDAQWELLTACFKKTMATKGLSAAAQQQHGGVDMALFKSELEQYRCHKMAEQGAIEVDSDAFDELRARRVANDGNIRQLEGQINAEKATIDGIEQNISDMERDILTLERYREELQITASQNEQALNDINAVNTELKVQFNELIKANEEKKRLIAAQPISGEKARQITAKRQSVTEELSLMRDALSKAEGKVYELQPKFYKESAKIRNDYNTFMSGLRGLCESLFRGEEALFTQLAELAECSFDQAFVEFQCSRDDNKLTRVLARLKALAEQHINAFRQAEANATRKRTQLQQQIGELESAKEQLQTEQKLELERAKREKEDKTRPLVDWKHSLDVVKQKHRAAADELDKYSQQLTKLHEELAEKHKSYMDYNQRLDAQYSELQAQVLEKMTKLCDRFQQIQDHKERYKQLGDAILAKNAKTLHEMRVAKSKTAAAEAAAKK